MHETIQEITTPEAWRHALHSFDRFESFHTWDFTRLEAGRLGCKAFALLVQQEGSRLFLPLLDRAIPGTTACDLTSAYGYPGPLYEGFPDGFDTLWRAALERLREKGYVSLFSRCSPVFTRRQAALPEEFRRAGDIVVVDLALPEAEQQARYRTNHQRDIRRAIQSGLRIEHGTQDDIADFVRLYYTTMDKVHAHPDYYFSHDYIAALTQATDFRTRLYLCKQGERTVAAGVFLYCKGIAQYYLFGSDTASLRLGSGKYLIDTARREAAADGYATLVLGGGSAGKQGSQLLEFKRGFSKDLVSFHVIRCVLDTARYEELCRDCFATGYSRPDFFPLYRFR
jgi:hypothetical protein